MLRRNARASLPAQPAKAAVIILIDNGSSHLETLFQSLKSNTIYPNYQVILIDNPPNSGFSHAKDYGLPDLRVYKNDKGLSIAEFCNRIITRLDAKYIVFLEKDVEPLYGWLNELIDFMDKAPDCAVAGPKIIYPELKKSKKNVTAPFLGLSVKNTGLCFRYGKDFIRPVDNRRIIHPLHGETSPEEVPALSGACMAWKRDLFLKLGGFDESFHDGYQGIDICLRARKQGYRAYYYPSSALIHHGLKTPSKGQENISVFKQKWSNELREHIWKEKFAGEAPFWTEHPLTIGIIITENHPATISGDYFTAHGLGKELEKFGYQVVYLPERPIYEWHYISPRLDILLVLRHTFDLRPLNKYPGIITIAWIRGYVDEWCRKPWFKEYDVVLASSEKSLKYAAQFIDPKKCLTVLRLAADVDQFKPGPVSPQYAADISFVGNLFEVPREFSQKLNVPPGITFNFYGRLENKKHWLRQYHRGEIPHTEIPEVYNSSKIVLEDCTPMCRPWGCINARTFEAMAAGACVISNEVPGLKGLFGDNIITYGTREDLQKKITRLLQDETKRNQIGEKARAEILKHHTYKHRARQFREVLSGFLTSTDVGAKIC